MMAASARCLEDAVSVEAEPFNLGTALLKGLATGETAQNATLADADARQYKATSIKQVDEIMFQPFCNRELFTTAIGVCDAIYPPMYVNAVGVVRFTACSLVDLIAAPARARAARTVPSERPKCRGANSNDAMRMFFSLSGVKSVRRARPACRSAPPTLVIIQARYIEASSVFFKLLLFFHQFAATAARYHRAASWCTRGRARAPPKLATSSSTSKGKRCNSFARPSRRK